MSSSSYLSPSPVHSDTVPPSPNPSTSKTHFGYEEVESTEKSGKVADGVRAMIVPGSGLVRAQAEAEGLDEVFQSAGFEWREPGCSMCLGMNPDILAPGERCASTSNRNFEGRQGRGARTHLVSPAMAAAALRGKFADVREFDGGDC